jgi:primosomal protein N' (replication factor Y)
MPDLVADIAVNVSVEKTFHYQIPAELRDRLAAGSRVLVPFGSRRIPGTVVAVMDKADSVGLKSVLEIVDEPLSPDLLALSRWMSDYYLYPLGQTIEAVLPKALSRAKPKTRLFIRLLREPATPAKGAKQAALLALLKERGEVDCSTLTGFSRAVLNRLRDSGIIELEEREVGEPSGELDFSCSEPPKLMPEQQEAVAAIHQAITTGAFTVFLLHGVTGSGKTEVYLQAMSEVARNGKGTIVLVPEIALTPQLLSRFRARFGSRVAVLHSGLTDRERADEYRRIHAGQVDVAIGARSAVFAPFARVGLIVVDEEHENSYKQDEGLRYHARDVAVMRAKFQNAVAVLGSATPSLESRYNARTDKYRYLRLASRVDHRPMPDVSIVDAKTMPRKQLYSPQLLSGIRERLEKKEQTLLLLNRRGFSSVLICRECGAALKCPCCSVSLTFHKQDRELKCHYCGHTARPPDQCPSCFGADLAMLGSGTQRIEEDLRLLFPSARIKRMDSDAVKGRDAYAALLQQVDRLEVDILLGTQMIAKGHDFPAVTLVGVVDADVGLNLPDFRSAEKTFQLITQAAGRSGRGEAAGEVIIQTMNPNHYSILHSRTHDYDGFYGQEMMFRTQLRYPPVGRIIKLEVKSAQDGYAKEGARIAQNRIRSLIKDKETFLLGPAPAPIAKVRGQYRYQLLLLSRKRELIRQLALEGRGAVEEKYGRKCRVIIDVDPVNLM